jgi:uncharacterized membrane protein
VVFILIALVWKGFEEKFIALSTNERKSMSKNVLIQLIPMLSLLVVTTWAGTYSPSFVNVYAFLTMLALAAIAVLYLAIIGVKRLIEFLLRKKKISQVENKINETAILYFISLILLSLTVFCCLFAILGSISTAMDINLGGYQAQDYNMSKWLLSDAVVLFISGTFGTGYSYLSDRSKNWRNTKETGQK